MKKCAILTILAILLTLLSLVPGCSQPSPADYQPPSKPTPTPVWVHQSSNLVNATITVSAGSYYDQAFSVVSTMTNARVAGSFRASGGSGNDIVALILDDIAYTNWVNGHQVSTFYNSSQVTVANIAVSITTPGRYHLVFSNRFSTFTSKQVATSVNLEWDELRY